MPATGQDAAPGAAWRSRWTRRAGERDLLARVRLLFSIFQLFVCAVLAFLALTAEPTLTAAGVATVLGSLGVVAAWGVWLYTRGRAVLALDVVPPLAAVAMGLAGAAADGVFSLLVVTFFHRALYGRRREVFVLALVYLAGNNVTVGVTEGWASLGEPALITNQLGFPVIAWVMGGLGAALRGYQRSVRHGQVLQRAGQNLVAARSQDEIYACAAEALLELVEQQPGARGSVWRLTDGVFHQQASAGAAPGRRDVAEARLRSFPVWARDAYAHGMPLLLDAEAASAVSQAVGGPATRNKALLVPFSNEEGPAGLLTVISPAIDQAVGDAVTRLGVVVGLALARADVQGLLRGVFASSGDALLVVSPEGAVLLANDAAESLFGRSADELRGLALSSLLEGAPETATAGTSDSAAVFECQVASRAGPPVDVEVTVNPLVGADRGGGSVVSVRDVTERKALQAEITHRALHDPLTSLVNRRVFHERVTEALARSRRSGEAIAVAFLDLDDFKTVNDSFGHSAGDQLLVTLAGRIRQEIRDVDTAARLGGDEFGLLLEGVESEEAALVALERVSEAIARPVPLPLGKVVVRPSVGVVLANPGGGWGSGSAEELLRDADVAMYRAKRGGKGRIEVYRSEMGLAALERMRTRQELLGALGRGEFTLHYQPIVALASGKPVGVAALARWEHPRRGLVAPDEFLPLAEEDGFILEIGRWVLRTACAQVMAWERSGRSPVDLAVTVSGREILHDGFIEEVAAALDEAGLAPQRLTLEVAEGTLMVDLEAASVVFAGLRELGVRVAIDDFGKGYSSLDHLQRLPVDSLKIDRSFVAAIDEGESGGAVAQAVLGLARNLGLEVVAEGVETRAQEQALLGWGCALGQGFRYARPLPPEEAVLTLTAAGLGRGGPGGAGGEGALWAGAELPG